ncbi:glycine zipper 2TM domain-containing protein [Sphingomonas sp. LaA6.9]|uniref:glycine zipper 2TM domain-containing protein n=1 Tax=Sphingomonas sp. LaA6.9 TaxID=2919914 RepID=UPI001F4F6216|nr:glycine zipper 2TM domain-containing protein [Sphingomonas sp. LaA6.9]MCJ8158918.1 glycine zipper 2TM domain-containing protein [Sphingomonas sp. LaA6.9]
MLKKLSLVGAALAMGAGSMVVPTAPAMARDGYYRDYDGGRYYRNGRYYGNNGYNRGYRGQRYYRSNAYPCHRDGTTGTIIGAVAGGLLGHEVVGRYGDKTAGAIIGAGVGALAGRAIDKSDSRCR